jgi:hypothetical protein
VPTWIRVRDTSTGHETDIDERSMRHGLEPLNDPRYPNLTGAGATPRPPKHFRAKDGKPATPSDAVPAGVPAEPSAETPENTDQTSTPDAGAPADSKKGVKR